MADRPIIFSAPMIQALLAGRKTQTRRLLPEPMQTLGREPAWEAQRGSDGVWRLIADTADVGGNLPIRLAYATGDRLWVRENVRAEELQDGRDGVRYPADDAWLPIASTAAAADRWLELFYYGGERGKDRQGRIAPSIHMPRWASRLTLVVTDVRVERLNDISEADAKAEGIRLITCLERGRDGFTGTGDDFSDTREQAFAKLWRSIHGADGWAANPWVVALTFSVQRANIDALAPAAAAAA